MERKNPIIEELDKKNSVILNTKGRSMRPLLKEGKTQVLVTPLDRNLEVGDLPLVYLGNDTFRIHRLIKIFDTCVYTRGDNCLTKEVVDKRNIVGVVGEIYKGDKILKLCSLKYRFYKSFLGATTPFRLLFFRIKYLIYKIGSKIKKIFIKK